MHAMFELASSYLIFIIILCTLSAAAAADPASTLQRNCYDHATAARNSANYVNCGRSPYMEYPFWKIDDELQDQQQQHCGYPGLGITCRPNKDRPPIITISNQSFYVLLGSEDVIGIRSDDRRRLTIVDPDFVETTCPRPRRNFTFSDHDFAEYSAIQSVRPSNQQELTFFLNCTSPPPPQIPTNSYLGINRSHHLECLDYNNITHANDYNPKQQEQQQMMMRSYAFFSSEIDLNATKEVYIQLLADWNRNDCKESVVAQVSSNSIIDRTITYMQFLQRGFEVMWDTPIECQRCESSGGFCSFSTHGKQHPITYNCWCRDHERQLRHDADGRGGYCFNYDALRNKVLIGVFSGVGGLMFITLLLVYCKIQRKRRRSIAKNVELFLESYGCRSSQRYTYKDIKKMTNSFKDKLGEGGFGSVFKGKLVDGRPVAVKVLINDPKKINVGEDFMNEVATIGSTNHVNIVALIGFCSSGPNRALVYEFMPNGSLEKFIYAKKEKSTTTESTTDTATITSASSNEVVLLLGWEKLYQIALGIARGLEYLHRGCNTGRILHFDIKPHNILLDENFCPKISDFGLAKLCTTRESIVSMLSGGRGTLGYIAPEVYNRNFGGVSYKSDVYSYGMMVLEMVGGRKNIDPFVENTSEIYFPHWIYNHLEKDNDKIHGLLKFEEALDEEMAKKMIMVGLWCIQTHQESRPSMDRVAEMLEGKIKDLQMPPNPFVDSSLHHQPPTS